MRFIIIYKKISRNYFYKMTELTQKLHFNFCNYILDQIDSPDQIINKHSSSYNKKFLYKKNKIHWYINSTTKKSKEF